MYGYIYFDVPFHLIKNTTIARAIAVETPTTITAMTIHRYMGILVEPGASVTDGPVDSVVG